MPGMTLVERLRWWRYMPPKLLQDLREAASELERLQKDLDEARGVARKMALVCPVSYSDGSVVCKFCDQLQQGNGLSSRIPMQHHDNCPVLTVATWSNTPHPAKEAGAEL